MLWGMYRPRVGRMERSGQVSMAYLEEAVAEKWRRAGMFFEAKDYAEAARILEPVVAELPEQLDARMLLARFAD